ncbi:hypothetical protein DPMN_168603 [Dreissena polymorpha]|uniref:Uncharacterized protein n=1 Tax=Dreissena polymorpha TaxID=45954 RepID=A0A9D4F0Y8_DREPO|nr:hypothetical protein DPMN_168603 [Dreissena polymorpha]
MFKLAQTNQPTNQQTNQPTDQQTGQKQYVPHYYIHPGLLMPVDRREQGLYWHQTPAELQFNPSGAPVNAGGAPVNAGGVPAALVYTDVKYKLLGDEVQEKHHVARALIELQSESPEIHEIFTAVPLASESTSKPPNHSVESELLESPSTP